MDIQLKLHRKRQKRARAWRLIVLVAFLVLATTLGCLHQLALKVRLVGVDALCTFGGLESLCSI